MGSGQTPDGFVAVFVVFAFSLRSDRAAGHGSGGPNPRVHLEGCLAEPSVNLHTKPIWRDRPKKRVAL